jgi:hypothetical protein
MLKDRGFRNSSHGVIMMCEVEASKSTLATLFWNSLDGEAGVPTLSPMRSLDCFGLR